MKTITVPARHPRVAHWKPYYINNSLTGIKMAKAAGYKYIDQDCQITSDGVIVVEHWGLPSMDGYKYIVVGHDKKGKEIREPDPNPNKSYGARPWSEVQRLRRRLGNSRPRTAVYHLQKCFENGLIPCFEMKSSKFVNPEVWNTTLIRAEKLDTVFIAMTLSTLPHPFAKLGAAQSKGIPAVLLNHSGATFVTRFTEQIKENTDAVWG